MIDRTNVKTLNADISAALAAVAAKHGMAIKTGALRFDSKSFTMTMSGVVLDEAELADKRLENLKPDWLSKAKSMGVFLKDFTYQGKQFTLTGFNGYCVIAYDAARGNNVKFPQASTNAVLTAARAA